MEIEFKLFGGLTVKEFTSLVMWLFFALFVYLLKLPSIIGLPIIVFFILLGIGFAFLKVNDQPFSRWAGNFLASIVLPQRKVWMKSAKAPESLLKPIDIPKHENVAGYSNKREIAHSLIDSVLQKRQYEREDDLEVASAVNIDKYMNDIFKNKGMYDSFLKQSQKLINERKVGYIPPHQPDRGLSVQQQIIPARDNEALVAIRSEDSAKLSHESLNKNASPNIIVGRVLDQTNRPIPKLEILVEDHSHTPVRRMVTNVAGIFSSQTPLPNGIYYVHATKSGGQKFTSVEVNLNGKSEKVITFKANNRQ